MTIADVNDEGGKIFVRVPKASLVLESKGLAVYAAVWLVFVICAGFRGGAFDNVISASCLAVLLFPAAAAIMCILFRLRDIRSGITFTFDRAADSVLFNRKIVGSIHSIRCIEVRGMAGFGRGRYWPTIWLAFEDRPDIVVVRTYRFGNFGFGSPMRRVDNNGKLLAELAAEAAISLARHLAEYCGRPLSVAGVLTIQKP